MLLPLWTLELAVLYIIWCMYNYNRSYYILFESKSYYMPKFQ